MALQLFPTLPGVAYNIGKIPTTSSRALEAASGVEYRAQNWASPKWKFSLPIEFLRQFATYTEYTTLVGFILSQAGMFADFLYNDQTDNTVVNQQIGVGNGSQVAFPLVRAIGSYVEPIIYCNSLNSVSLSGVVQTTGYSLVQTGYYGPDTVLFTTAPTAGVPVQVNFNFNFVCRFLQDDPDFAQFMSGRYMISKLDFQSVK